MEELPITIEDSASPEDIAVVHKGLDEYNTSCAGEANYGPLRIFVRDEKGAIVGGLLGEHFYGWLHVDILWVDEQVRGNDYGSKLMAAAEAEALRRGCRHCLLDTFSFQALPFYEKLGYETFGVLDDYPGEHERIFLRKTLSPG